MARQRSDIQSVPQLKNLVCTYFAVHTHTAGSKQALTAILESNEDVLFQWCMITASIDEKDATELLHQLIELYITIRGFSFATSCVEFYKISYKKSLQKGKGIRKELFYK